MGGLWPRSGLAVKTASVILHVHICQKYIQIQHRYELVYPCCICQTYIQICTYICTRYRQVHIGYAQCISHMHTPVSACICLYLYVSQAHRSCIQCICVCMSDTFNPHTGRYTQICTHEGSSYLHVSACIVVLNTC